MYLRYQMCKWTGVTPYERLRLPERSIQWRNMAAYPRASGSVRSCSTVKRMFLPQFGYCQVVAGRFCW